METISTTQTTEGDLSLYDLVGGDQAIHSLVGALYFYMLNDERISRFFDGIEVPVLLRHQKEFLKFLFGGEDGYSGRSMREAHRSLVEKQGLSDSHFDALVETAANVLRDLGYSNALVVMAVTRIESLRNDVLGREH